MRTDNLKHRLKLAWQLIVYGKDNARIMTCGKCGAMNLSSIAEHQPEFPYKKDDFDIDLVWSDFVMCKNCGAVCEETQKWNFAGDPKKINPNVHAKYPDNNSPKEEK